MGIIGKKFNDAINLTRNPSTKPHIFNKRSSDFKIVNTYQLSPGTPKSQEERIHEQVN